jgi:plasmid segregation protein ParM
MHTKVFALDIGYGNTKCAYRNPDGTITKEMFPSLAPFCATNAVSASGAASGNAGFSVRDVIAVKVGDTFYDVGPDVPLTGAYGKTGRALTDAYVRTNNYTALLAGAIYRARVHHIERLVLGLPVHTMAEFARELKERFKGEHDFGHGIIKIDAVSVVPQPLGSMTYAANKYPDIRKKRRDNLLIDVGYFTTDWVYLGGDFKIDDLRSGGHPGGVSHVLQRIAESIGRQFDRKVYDLERIDACLREQDTFRFYSHELNLIPYLEEAQVLIKANLTMIGQHVGALQSVESIVLSGGGSHLYYRALREIYSETSIHVLDDPCYANALGFLELIESMMTVH